MKIDSSKAAALLTLVALAEVAKTQGPAPTPTPAPPVPTPPNPLMENLFQDIFSPQQPQSPLTQVTEMLEAAVDLMGSMQQLQELVAPELGDPGLSNPFCPEQSLFSPEQGPFSPLQQNAYVPPGPGGPGPTNGPGSTNGPSPSGGSTLGPGLPPELEGYRGEIEAAAAQAQVPADMLAAQIWQESRGNLAATSTNGGNGLTDTGLMQVNPNTFGELQAKHPELQGLDLSKPDNNILAGAFYMKDMKEEFGDWKTALRAYNSGPRGVDKNNLNALPAGTGDATYVDKVSSFWETIKSGNGTLPP